MSKIKAVILSAAIIALTAGLFSGAPVLAAEKGLKQPVFLLCPHKARYSAWSIFLMVDENDHQKVLSLGLEELKKQNSKDASYEAVLAAQNDPHVEHKLIGLLEAKDFSSGQLKVQKDDALQVSLTPVDNEYDLGISLRVGMSDRFVIGGKERAKRDIALVYDEGSKQWAAKVKTLQNNKGQKLPDADGRPMTGIVFPVTGTGIYVVMGVFDDGEPVALMDRSE